jgi:hypothetical protein
MNKLLDHYGMLLDEVDTWFRRCLDLYPDLIACHHGCSECCRGLFDITLLDAYFLKRGFDKLSDDLKTELVQKATQRLKLKKGWGLHHFPKYRTCPEGDTASETAVNNKSIIYRTLAIEWNPGR